MDGRLFAMYLLVYTMDSNVRFANSPGMYMAHPIKLVHPFLVASLVALLAGTLSIACSSTLTTVHNNSDAGSIGGSANGGNSNSQGGTNSSAGGTHEHQHRGQLRKTRLNGLHVIVL